MLDKLITDSTRLNLNEESLTTDVQGDRFQNIKDQVTPKAETPRIIHGRRHEIPRLNLKTLTILIPM